MSQQQHKLPRMQFKNHRRNSAAPFRMKKVREVSLRLIVFQLTPKSLINSLKSVLFFRVESRCPHTPLPTHCRTFLGKNKGLFPSAECRLELHNERLSG